MSNIIYKIWNPASPSPSPVKVDPLNIESQNQPKNIPVVLPNSTIQICCIYPGGLLCFFSGEGGSPSVGALNLPDQGGWTPTAPHINPLKTLDLFKYRADIKVVKASCTVHKQAKRNGTPNESSHSSEMKVI